MFFLLPNSSNCVKSELDLFTTPPTQTSVESGCWTHYKPVSSLSDNAPIEFSVSGRGDEYVDLAHTYLHLQVKVVPQKSTTPANKVAAVNNFIHSLFSQVDVFFNQKLVSPQNNTYPYRAYIENTLNYEASAKNSHLGAALYLCCSPGRFADIGDPETSESIQFVNAIKDQRTLDLIAPLHCDAFNQEKYLLNGVDVLLRLIRSKDSFCLMQNGDCDYRTRITETTLLIRKVKISPMVLIAHAKALAQTPAKYPITRVEVKSLSIPSGVMSESLDNVFMGQLPKRIIIGFVSNKAFNGHPAKNPFNFHHFKMNHLSLYVDGVQIPSRPLQPNYAEGTWVQNTIRYLLVLVSNTGTLGTT